MPERHHSPLAPARRAFRDRPSGDGAAKPERGGARHQDKKRLVPRGLGHGRRNRGFAPDEADQKKWNLDPETLPREGFTVQVAPRGFLSTLLEELGGRTITVMGRLVLTHGREKAHWAQTAWLAPRWIPISSIRDAAHKLRDIQRNWRAHGQEQDGCNRRMALIEEELPHVSCRPVTFGDPAPAAPLGAFTLWNKDLLLASPATSSAFPDGEVPFVEDKVGPPGRAYLKLWESFTILGKKPQPGELCLDLGAAPGSWSWVLGRLGCRVFSIDKAPLADSVACMPNVNHCLGSGFGLDPSVTGTVDWLFSDMICYPSRLLTLVRQWIDRKAMKHALCTLKFQAETDHETARAFAEIPGSWLGHLSCNKHELTWYWEET